MGEALGSIMMERYVIQECLNKYGYQSLAIDVVKTISNNERIKDYLIIIQREAKANKDEEVLERLYFAGLIYGKGAPL